MGFELTILGEFAKVQGGYAYKSKDFQSTGDCPVLKIKNVRYGHIEYAETAFIVGELGKETKGWSTREGDILISMTGSGPNAPQSLVGRVGRVWREDPKAWINQRVGRIQVKPQTLHPDFIFYLLTQKESQNFLVSNSSGSANQANISGKTIELLPCPKVEFEESRYIADILRSLDEKVILNRQTNETLEKMAQALFKSWFVDFDPVIDNALAAGNTIPDELQDRAERRQQQLAKPDHQPLPDDIRQLFPSEFELTEALGWVPMGWEIKPLDEIAHYQNGLALQKFRPENERDFLPVLKIAHLKQGSTDGEEKASTDIKPSCIVDNGDIIFSWSGSLMVDIWCGGKAALNQHLFKVTSEVFPRWYYYFFTVHHLLEFQRIAADKAVTMGHIKREHLSQAKCTVPPIYLLAAGSEHIEPLIEQQIILRKESKQLAKLRDTLLPKLISGELRLPSDASADAEQQLANAIS